MEMDTPAKFKATFQSLIRVDFNWDRFHSEQWSTTSFLVSDRNELGKFFLPWYLESTGLEVAYNHPYARPIQLARIPAVMASLNSQRQAAIKDYTTQFSDEQLVEFLVPSYYLGNNRYLVLDGNH